MAGKCRSLGCKTCKERRIKCDETQPTCLRCIKAQRFCPGPLPVHQFVRKQSLKKGRSPRKGYNVSSKGHKCDKQFAGQPQPPLLLKKVRSTKGGALYQTLELLPKANDVERRLQKTVPRSPSSSNANRLTSVCIDTISRFTSLGMNLAELGSFLLHVPSRIGHSQALDDAVTCIVYAFQIHCGRDIGARKRYAKALVSLRRSLEDEKECKSAETLGAAMTLYNYEIVCAREEEETSWLTHAGGASALMQARGAESFNSDFEKNIILSHHCGLLSMCLSNASDCFLNSPTWEPVFSSMFDNVNLKDTDARANMMYHKVLHAMGGAIPPILRHLQNTTKKKSSAEVSFGYLLAQEFKACLVPLETYFESTLGDSVIASFAPWPDNDPTLPAPPYSQYTPDENMFPLGQPYSLKYSSAAAARAHVHFFACKILANLLQAHFDPGTQAYFQDGPRIPVAHIDSGNSFTDDKISLLLRYYVPMDSSQVVENSKYASLIHASLPFYRSVKPLGACHLVFPFQMASAIASTEEKEWMARGLNQLFDKLILNFEVKQAGDESGRFGGIALM